MEVDASSEAFANCTIEGGEINLSLITIWPRDEGHPASYLQPRDRGPLISKRKVARASSPVQPVRILNRLCSVFMNVVYCMSENVASSPNPPSGASLVVLTQD
jgi:hypothetical protein